MGAGGWTSAGTDAANAAAENNGTLLVWSHRSEDGFVQGGQDHGVGSGEFNPQKSRYLLMLAINAGYGEEQLSAIFDKAPYS